MIDLHLHSTASDGTDTPSQLIKKAIDYATSRAKQFRERENS